MANHEILSVNTVVHADMKKVWDSWTLPEHITQWCRASEGWHTPRAENDVREGGRFCSHMAAKDGSAAFDFSGKYDVIAPESYIEYTMDDGRRVKIKFTEEKNGVHISETFEAESTNPLDMQQAGWQAILDSFKKYTEQLKQD